MEHSAYKEMLSALLDGELSGAEREAALAHMEGCADCRAYFDELTALRAALGELEEFDAPEGFAAGVTARARAEGKTAQPRAEGAAEDLRADSAPSVRKKHMARRGYAALAACAAVALLAVYALPNTLRMGSMGAGNSAADRAVHASPSSTPASSVGAAGEPSAAQAAPAAAPDSASGYAYSNGALMESSMDKEGGAADNAAATASEISRETDGAEYSQMFFEAENDDEKLPIQDNGEAPAAPLTDPAEPAAPRGDEPLTLTLSGEGAALWLAEHGRQGESGAWYVDADTLRALPETLALPDGGVPEDYDGAVLIELWVVEP